MTTTTNPYVSALNKVAVAWLLKHGYALSKGAKSMIDYDYYGFQTQVFTRDVYYVLNWAGSNKAFGRMLKANGLRLKDQKGGAK